MKKVRSFMMAVMFLCGFSAEVFAQEDMGLGKRAAAQMETIHRDRVSNVLLVEGDSEKNILLSDKENNSVSRVRISPVKCLYS